MVNLGNTAVKLTLQKQSYLETCSGIQYGGIKTFCSLGHILVWGY